MTTKTADVPSSAKKARTHTVYKNAAGKRVPGVTTITGVLDKPALVFWANKLGLEGIDSRTYVDDLAGIGTCGHAMIEAHIKSLINGEKVEPDLGVFTGDQIALAENVYIKFLSWEKEVNPKYIGSELKLVSEKMQVGGTLDIYCSINGLRTLVDLKTSKAVYQDHHLQVAGGYEPILEDNGLKVEDVRILRIGRDESEGDREYLGVPNRKGFQELFQLCYQIYKKKQELKFR